MLCVLLWGGGDFKDKRAGGADTSSSSDSRDSNDSSDSSDSESYDDMQVQDDFNLSRRVTPITRPRSGSLPLSLPSKEKASDSSRRNKKRNPVERARVRNLKLISEKRYKRSRQVKNTHTHSDAHTHTQK